MKIAFIVYRDIHDDRISEILEKANIDNFVQWENVKAKYHNSPPHLGTRVFPGYEFIRMITFQDDNELDNLIDTLQEFNKTILLPDDQVRLFQIPLERMI